MFRCLTTNLCFIMGTGDKERSLLRRPLAVTTFQSPSVFMSSGSSDTASWSPRLASLLVSLPDSDSTSEFSFKPNKSMSGWGLRSSESVMIYLGKLSLFVWNVHSDPETKIICKCCRNDKGGSWESLPKKRLLSKSSEIWDVEKERKPTQIIRGTDLTKHPGHQNPNHFRPQFSVTLLRSVSIG